MKSTDPVDNLINILSVDCLNCSIAGMGFDLHGEKEGIKKCFYARCPRPANIKAFIKNPNLTRYDLSQNEIYWHGKKCPYR